MSVLPGVAWTTLENPKDYNPGYVEEEILKFLRTEYKSAQALMSSQYERFLTEHEQAHGVYIRDVHDNGPCRDLYEPFVAINHRTRHDVHLSRLYPDRQRFDSISVKLEEIMDPMAVQAEAEALGVSTDAYVEHAENVLTMLLRRYVRTSNYIRAREKMAEIKDRHGFCLAFTEKNYSPVKRAVADALDSMMMDMPDDPIEAMLMEEDGAMPAMPESGEASQDLQFSGLRFVVVSPFNLVIPSLTESGGITALKWFAIRNRRSWRELVRHRIRNGEGCYANTECLSVKSEEPISSENTEDIGITGEDRRSFDSYDVGGFWDETSTVQSHGMFLVPMYIGRFEAEQVPAFREKPPTPRQWNAFARKFNFDPEKLETSTHWVIEWVEKGTGPMLRFQPYDLSFRDRLGRECVAVESRCWEVPNMTLGISDYAIGAGDLEIQANNALQDILEQSRRISRPMFAFDETALSRDFRQKMKGRLPHIPGGLIPVVRAPQLRNGDLLSPIGPNQQQVDIGVRAMNLMVEQIQRIVGVAEQFQGQSGGAESAQEASQQGNYLEQLIAARNAKDEEELDRPLLERALALIIDELANMEDDEMAVFATQDELALWQDKYQSIRSIGLKITKDMVAHGFGLHINTASTLGNREQQLTRLERLFGMAQQYNAAAAPVGQPTVPLLDILATYSRRLGESHVIKGIQPSIVPAPQQGSQSVPPLAPAAPNPGGAGTPRPGYDRNQPEMSAPGEPTGGLPLMSGTPGVEMEGL